MQAPQTEPQPGGSASGALHHYTPQASGTLASKPISKASSRPGPATAQTPRAPVSTSVSASDPSQVAPPLANLPTPLPGPVATASQPVVSVLGISGSKAEREMSYLLVRSGGDPPAGTIKHPRGVAPSFLLSHVDNKKGTVGWDSAAPDDSAVDVLQGAADSGLDAPATTAPLEWAAGLYKGAVDVSSVAGVPFSMGERTTALPGSSPVTVESASHDPLEPSAPSSLPEGSNLPFSLSSSQLSSNGGSAPLLLLLAGALAAVLFLLGLDGQPSWASLQLLKPSSPLIPVLERPG